MLSRFRKLKKSVSGKFKRPAQGREEGNDEIPSSSSQKPSALEELPRELVFKIIEFVPEKVCDLRQTSRTLKSHMVALAAQPSIFPLAERVVLTPHRVEICVPERKSKLFEQRLKARFAASDMGMINRIAQYEVGRNSIKYMLNHYSDLHTVDSLRISMGAQVPVMEVMDKFDAVDTEEMLKMLELFHFQHLKMNTETFSDEYGAFLLRLIERHKIEKVTLSVYHTTILEPVNFLLELSSQVRSLCIIQNYPKGSIANQFFFGIENEHWAPNFIEMLSRKLDKLCIINTPFPAYLTWLAADVLKERLPYLDKKIWFSATCECYLEGIEDMENDNVIQADSADVPHRSLRIKHWSRKDEEF